jgi:glycosyltransferase involved in cell wall biosynthesis
MARFSVLMANYNNSAYIGDAIRSLFSQTFNDWELVIVDDASTDNSLSVIEEYLHDKRVRLYARDKNAGYTNSLIFGLTKIMTNIVGILDSDDALVPAAIEKIYNIHTDKPQVGLVLSQSIVCDAALTPLYNTTNTPVHLTDPMLWLRGTTHFRTFKKHFYDRTRQLSNAFSIASDWDLVIKLEEVAPTHRIDEPLYIYRQLPASISHSAVKFNLGYSELCLIVYNAYLRRLNTTLPNLPPQVVAAWTTSGTRYSIEAGKFRRSIAFALRTLRIAPFALASYRTIAQVFKSFRQAFGLPPNRERLFFPVHRLQSNTGNMNADRIECIPIVHKTGHALFGGDQIIFLDGIYRAIFALRIKSEFFSQDPIIVLDVYENLQTKSLLAQRPVLRAEADHCVREFSIQFAAVQGQRLEFRVHWGGQCYLTIYGVVLERVVVGDESILEDSCSKVAVRDISDISL